MLAPLDAWKLVDELRILDASILIAGGDPTEIHNVPLWALPREHSKTQALLAKRVQSTRRRKPDVPPSLNSPAPKRSDEQMETDAAAKSLEQYARESLEAKKKIEKSILPICTALKSAIMSDKMRANFRLRQGVIDPGESAAARNTVFSEIASYVGQKNASLSMQSSADCSALPHGFDNKSILESAVFLWIDWEETTIPVDEIKTWLKSRNLAPAFFFSSGDNEDFMRNDDERYSAELACAVAAWRAVKRAPAGKTVKHELEQWILANANLFGVSSQDGVPKPSSVERIATLVNWRKAGGAPKSLADD